MKLISIAVTAPLSCFPSARWRHSRRPQEL